MDLPLVSIIVPVYNVEQYLVQCLDSLINQTYNNIEIITVNDGSQDNCLEILEKYVRNDARIKIINQNNKGPSSARNSGIGICNGDYIMFVDSDDWIDSCTCEYGVAQALLLDADVVLWSYIREYDNHKTLKKDIFNQDVIFYEQTCKELYRRFFGLVNEQLRNPEHADSIVSVCMKLYKRSIIKENNIVFIDTKITGTAEDALFNINFFYYISKATYIHRHFYHYRKTNVNSFTTLYKPHLLNQWISLFDYMRIAISTFCLDKTFETALSNRIALSIIGLGLNECSSQDSNSEQIKKLSIILKHEQFRTTLKSLPLKYFPIHWKLFFISAKNNWSTSLWILLKFISKIIKGHY